MKKKSKHNGTLITSTGEYEKRCVLFLIILFLAAVASSCNENTPLIYSAEELCVRYLPAVTEIRVSDADDNAIGLATGTVISNDGLILTNRHVVRGFNYQTEEYEVYAKIAVRFYNEEEYSEAEIIAISDEYDLTLLKLSRVTEAYFNIAESGKLRFGEEVHTIGNGSGYGLAYSGGNVAAPLREIAYEGEVIEAIQLSLIISEGNSGGPLFNGKGELIGVTTFRLRDAQGNVNYGTCFALPAASIINFIDNVSV
ncbi:MAG: S1C family serine protease [Clostridiaceae bacterium]|jgi:serine protease Do|nr:S1C family serine protease [Clostridiaceae bacterium]